jgi:hypothetical protein
VARGARPKHLHAYILCNRDLKDQAATSFSTGSS